MAEVVQHRERAVRVARARGAKASELEDCVQEAMARVVAMPRLDLDRIGPLLTVVVANVVTDLHRAGHRGQRLEARLSVLDRELEGDEERVCDVAEATWLRGQLKGLRDRERAVMELRAEGHSLPETAALLGMTYKAAESAFTRARNSLKTAWRATLGLLGVVSGGRVARSTPVLAVAVSVVGASVAALALWPSGDGAEVQAVAAPSSRPAADGPPHVREPRPHATPVTGRGLAEVTASETQQRQSRAPQEVAGVGRIELGPMRQEPIAVKRYRDDETMVDSVVRCLLEGLNLDPWNAGCPE